MTTGGPSHRHVPTLSVPERPAGLSDRPRSPGSPAPGDQVGRYVVESELGRGGMGRVFAASDPALQRRVALKVVRPDDDQEARERMLREARAMASLSHPNVVAIHDVGTLDDGQIFLAMELVDGHSLRDALHDDEGRSQRALLDLYVQAGRGLAAAHEAGLVHRDFKPENVFIGSDGRARVGDFGLVCGEPRAPEGAAGRQPTLTAAVLGTPQYMAPEQHVGAPASQETDQYAFAVALYEALAGVRPFDGTYQEIQGGKLGAGRPPWPPHRSLPPALTTAIDRALSLDPRGRYPSMRDFLAAIEAAGSPPEPMAPPRRSGPPTAMSAPLAPGAYPQYPNTRPAPQVQIVAPPRPDRTLFYVLGAVMAAVMVIGLVAGVVILEVRHRDPGAPSNLRRIPPAGPLPTPPAFSVTPSPTPESKVACPPGSTFRKEQGARVIELYCATSSVTDSRDGTAMKFDPMTRRLVRYETRVHGKLQGQIWSFASTGSPTTMEEYSEGMLDGTSWQFASSGSIHARDHYENGKRHGLTEYWNAATGAPGGAELYQNGVLVGRSF